MAVAGAFCYSFTVGLLRLSWSQSTEKVNGYGTFSDSALRHAKMGRFESRGESFEILQKDMRPLRLLNWRPSDLVLLSFLKRRSVTSS